MTDYVDNMKKSIFAAQETLVQKIHDEIERSNAANREAIIRMLEEVGLWRILEVQALLPHLERFADLVAAEERKALKEERRRDMEEIYSLREAEESLREENERLREALKKYGQHRSDCAKTLGGYQCTCGFNQQG